MPGPDIWKALPIEPEVGIASQQQNPSRKGDARRPRNWTRKAAQRLKRRSTAKCDLRPGSSALLEMLFGLVADTHGRVKHFPPDQLQRYIRHQPQNGSDRLAVCIRLRQTILRYGSLRDELRTDYLTPALLRGLRLERGSCPQFNQAFGRIWHFCNDLKAKGDDYGLQLRWFQTFNTPSLDQCEVMLRIWRCLRKLLARRTNTPRPDFRIIETGQDPVIEWVMRQGLQEIDHVLKSSDPHLKATQMYTQAQNKSDMPVKYLETACEAWMCRLRERQDVLSRSNGRTVVL